MPKHYVENGATILIMLKKIFLISLVLLLPVQAWAGLDMSFKHQTNMTGVAAQEISHNCHQASASNEEGAKLSAQSEGNGCNSCALCMAFCFTLAQFFIGTTDFSQIYAPGQINFVSHDTSALKKPPIL